MKRYALIDRDGTLIEECHYLSEPDAVKLIPRAAEGLRKLQASGWGLIVLTNQSAVGRGRISEARLAEIHVRLNALLRAEGVGLDGIYYCPHTAQDQCRCRKPEPGLVESAARQLGFDPAACVVVGDKRCDIDLGRRVGAKTILVRTGYGAQELAAGAAPDYVADDLLMAAEIVCAQM